MQTTNQPARAPKRAKRKNKTILPTFATAITLFVLMTGFLGFQVSSGADPSLSARNQTTQVAQVKKTTPTSAAATQSSPAPVQTGAS
jgi:hypothetical protein